jgi:hypothetical protein
MAKFSTLLEATAKSPAMLFYLDNFQSVTPNPQRNPGAGQRRPIPFRDLINLQRRPGIDLRQEQRIALRHAQRIELRQAQQPRPQPPQQQQRRGINENYARELMELHTLGVDGGYAEGRSGSCSLFYRLDDFPTARWCGCVNALMGSDPARRNAALSFQCAGTRRWRKIVLGHKIPAGAA